MNHFQDIKFKTFSGENLKLVVLDKSLIGLGLVSCIKFEDMQECDAQGLRFQSYCENTTGVYTPR